MKLNLRSSILVTSLLLGLACLGAVPVHASGSVEPLAFLNAGSACASPLASLFAPASPEISAAPEVLRWNPGETLDLGTQVGSSCARYCRETCIANGEPCCIIDYYTCGCC